MWNQQSGSLRYFESKIVFQIVISINFWQLKLIFNRQCIHKMSVLSSWKRRDIQTANYWVASFQKTKNFYRDRCAYFYHHKSFFSAKKGNFLILIMEKYSLDNNHSFLNSARVCSGISQSATSIYLKRVRMCVCIDLILDYGI